MTVHPLIFEPLLVPKVWGGRALERIGRQLPAGAAIGESWEAVDLPGHQSVVAVGPAKGRTLGQLVREWGDDLTGRAALVDGGFPLLIKFLDAREPLSIQVHPGPTTAAPGTAIKHEAWYVIEASPDAVIYRGVKRGVTRERLADAAGSEAIVDLIEALPVKAGQCLYCPGGTVHALGGGLLVAEVQTPCDVTYRLFDWDRTRPAEDAGSHVEEGLAAIEWGLAPPPTRRSHVGGLFTTVTRLLACEAFTIEKVRFLEGMEQEIPYAEPVIWIMLEGHGAVAYESGPAIEFKRGDVVLLPAGMKNGRVNTQADCVWLEVTVPVR